ncbi:MAG: putative teichoic acid linkage unit synthesis [Actinomycetia bacterium]|nr:putative teichoic acid linkage unit synthesis [Actinomycetes bacterium]
MREYGLTVLVAFAVTYLLTPLVRRFAIAVGAEHKGRARDVHIEPVPLLGGFAMYLGLAAGLMVASRLTHLSTVFTGTRVASGLLLAGAVVVLMGFVDDRWGLGVITKLAGQVAAGGILVWSGAVVYWLPLPGGGTLLLSAPQQTVLTILVVVVTINAVNFIDGLDGLATGIVGIGAAAFFFYYYTLTKRLGLDQQTGPALASAILTGVCLGFLPHNFHPARIFMGDTGSMLLGLLLAYAPISSIALLDPRSLTSPSAYSGGTVNRFPEILPLLVPATIMLIPYADLLLAVVRRTRAGQSPFSADKKHLQHRLLAIGHSHRASVLLMYLWASLFAGTVVLLSIIRTKLLILGVVTLAGVLVLLLASLPRLRPWNRRGQLRLATDIAGPVPSAGTTPPAGSRAAARAGSPAGAGPSGSPMASRVPAEAGVSARGRDRVDRGASMDRGAREDRGLGTDPGLGADPGLGVGRPAGADRGPGLDRPARADRGPGLDRGAGADRHGPGGRPQGPAGAGYGDSGRRDTGYENGWHGDSGREHAANRDAWYRDTGRRDAGTGDAAYGAGGPGQGRAGAGWDARPAPAAREARPSGSAWDAPPAGPPRPPEAPWDARPASAVWDVRPAARDHETPPPAEAGPAPHGHAAPAGGGRTSDPGGGGRTSDPGGGGRPSDPAEPREPGHWYPGRVDSGRPDSGRPDSGRPDSGRPDSGQWYPGRPDPARPDSAQRDSGQRESGQRDSGQWDSGRWDARPHHADPRDADRRDADRRDASLYAAPPPAVGPHEVGPQDTGAQHLDPLSVDPGRAQRPGTDGTRPADRDGHDYSDDEESPLLPWRFL